MPPTRLAEYVCPAPFGDENNKAHHGFNKKCDATRPKSDNYFLIGKMINSMIAKSRGE